jgi:hypothetical protein
MAVTLAVAATRAGDAGTACAEATPTAAADMATAPAIAPATSSRVRPRWRVDLVMDVLP